MSASTPLEDVPRSEPSSRFPGFYRLDIRARHHELMTRYGLSADDVATLADGGALGVERADRMVENCVGVMGLPLALGLNFRVNGRDVAVPMAVEEPSIVAAVSNAARLVRDAGGFQADADPSVMIAQIQVLDVVDPEGARDRVLAARAELCREADRLQPSMARRGGGARDVEVRWLGGAHGMLVVHVLIDCLDAMGANLVNTVAEGLAPRIEQLTGGRTNLRILSNLADRRLARASCAIPEGWLAQDGLSGEQVAHDIVQACHFAAIDPYRAATHNKGVMNGIDAVAIATGNDWRGVEAGAHAYAARGGRYTSLTRWWREEGCLRGHIELPMAVGVVGGSTTVHPTVRVMRKLLRCRTARELAEVMAAVGLAQNFGAIRALATDGIQRGHMALHARTVALAKRAEAGLDG